MNRNAFHRISRILIRSMRIPPGSYVRTLSTFVVSTFVIVSFATLAQPAAPGLVPNPTVIGPIPASVPPGDPSHLYRFFSTTANLASHGYVEEEFFFAGTANRYNNANQYSLVTATIFDSGHPYRTRMIVRRPASPGKFNGTVVLEWQNVTAGYDLDAAWVQAPEHYMRRGYAWIGVSAQRAGVHEPLTGLKDWSPSRYSTLDVTEGGTIYNDALCWDIFSQAAQAIRTPMGVDPMGGLHVERTFAIGVSQGAIRLLAYHNCIHPLAGVLDGFIVVGGGRLVRTDLDTKVFKVMSETDVAGDVSLSQALLRQPDSEHFRHWEVAGSAHLGFYAAQALDPLQLRDLGPQTPESCDNSPFSRIPYYFVVNAVLDHLVYWVKFNIKPPTMPEIEVEALGPPTVIARDAFGNALGGIRLSQLAVPTATNTGLNSSSVPYSYCSLYGTFQPFDDATIKALYPNHGAYVRRVSRVTFDNLQKGFIAMEDAVETIREAAQSGIGKR
jgi:hypothetical protein